MPEGKGGVVGSPVFCGNKAQVRRTTVRNVTEVTEKLSVLVKRRGNAVVVVSGSVKLCSVIIRGEVTV